MRKDWTNNEEPRNSAVCEVQKTRISNSRLLALQSLTLLTTEKNVFENYFLGFQLQYVACLQVRCETNHDTYYLLIRFCLYYKYYDINITADICKYILTS